MNKYKKGFGKGWHHESYKHSLAARGIKFKKGNIPDYKFNSSQLKKGIKVETEHTNDKSIAKQIAKAHLSEMQDYYIRLDRMEKGLCTKGNTLTSHGYGSGYYSLTAEGKVSLSKIKLLYQKAVDEKKDQFELDGKPVLTSYAKYLIQYLEGEYKRRGMREVEKIPIQTMEAKGKKKEDPFEGQALAYSKSYQDLKDKYGEKFGKKISKENEELQGVKSVKFEIANAPINKQLSNSYKDYWTETLSAKGFNKSEIDDLLKQRKLKVKFIPSNKYSNMEDEKERRQKGEMSYAETKIKPNEIDVIVRKSDKRLNNKLLTHELEELAIFNQLQKKGIEDVDLAHKLTKTKVNNTEVDKAFGDIGDPI